MHPEATSTSVRQPLSPLREPVRVVRQAALVDGGWRSAASFRVRPDEPVLAGHFPGFPIFPGVCVIEAVLQAATRTAPPEFGPLHLDTVESARFRDAVYPGDTLAIEVEWDRVDQGTGCAARVSTERGLAALVRLRLRRGDR
ncbi:3-hydroxyacyl-ACP dehydratase FabZ family protein [Micromonospora sp. NBC_01796]|uniref:3-hydroxyacyl-ACP dehydratase FabZ family protein n=1 Tax=Micromonospora sp. NBC_01796 TaxID=2975987 RepID=UPI002DD8ECB5|nr:3-hydroxyacyl-ACP dehydratase FabZ family protein [Micromonospora sp. NBC_01796]WSA85941.1 beta-hydroxyacyl-ACP dehydratase [Micromonospora sp. NBC_01796]